MITRKQKEELLRKILEEMKAELTLDNFDIDTIIEDADSEEAYYYKRDLPTNYERTLLTLKV